MPKSAASGGPALPEFLREGALLAGKYRVGAPLGAGGMGLVLAAEHHTLGTKVALKVLHRDRWQDADLPARFVREGRAAAALHSEHVVRIYDLDLLPDGQPYMAMERLEGADLGELLDLRPRLLPSEAVEIARQTCVALCEAHEAGIVHRDLKPQNLFLAQRSGKPLCVKVLDFGIAKFLDSSIDSVDLATRSHMLMGSPVYMSPEQMRAAQGADARSDLWSLGVVLYQMLSGDLPFDAGTLPELCAKVLTERAQPLNAAALQLPDGLAEIVMRLLEPNPGHRFDSAEQLLRALTPHAPPQPITLPEIATLMLQRQQAAPQHATMPSALSETRADPGATTALSQQLLEPSEEADDAAQDAEIQQEIATPLTAKVTRREPPPASALAPVRPTIAEVLAADQLALAEREQRTAQRRRRASVAALLLLAALLALASWHAPQLLALTAHKPAPLPSVYSTPTSPQPAHSAAQAPMPPPVASAQPSNAAQNKSTPPTKPSAQLSAAAPTKAAPQSKPAPTTAASSAQPPVPTVPSAPAAAPAPEAQPAPSTAPTTQPAASAPLATTSAAPAPEPPAAPAPVPSAAPAPAPTTAPATTPAAAPSELPALPP